MRGEQGWNSQEYLSILFPTVHHHQYECLCWLHLDHRALRLNGSWSILHGTRAAELADHRNHCSPRKRCCADGLLFPCELLPCVSERASAHHGSDLTGILLLDMLETAINIWSDACVTAIVDRETLEMEESGARINTQVASSK